MLSDLKILNGFISPEFKEDIYDYTVDMSDDSSLDLVYNSIYPVTIYGNDDLTEGENHVLIEVYDNTKVTTYTLLVNKSVTKTVSNFNNEVDIKKQIIDDIKTPLIVSICFILIIILFCIIFKKHKKYIK